jgi:hypothetical protein
MLRELRPRFDLQRDEPASVLLDRISFRLRSGDCSLCGFVAEDRVALYVPPARQRLWSAELRADVIRQGNTTLLECRYAPHPHVWITYVITLAVIIIGITAALVFALAELSMHQPPVALFAFIPLLLLGVALYAAAFVGQGFAVDEMDELRAFLNEALQSGTALPSHIRNLRPQEVGESVRDYSTR